MQQQPKYHTGQPVTVSGTATGLGDQKGWIKDITPKNQTYYYHVQLTEKANTVYVAERFISDVKAAFSQEWQPFSGDYEKKVQDIKLKDGSVIEMCYPNSGVFMCLSNNSQKDIPVKDVAFVRLAHKDSEQ